MLLTENSSGLFPKHKKYLLISEYFALNIYIFVALTNKNLLLPL